MQIYNTVTGKVLEKDLTITTVNEAMERRLRAAASNWEPQNIEIMIAGWKRSRHHPFNFAIEGNDLPNIKRSLKKTPKTSNG